MSDPIVQYFQCPKRYIRFETQGHLSTRKGYFRFGDDTICYGRLSNANPCSQPNGTLPNVTDCITSENGITYLPFELTEVIDDLRGERYSAALENGFFKTNLEKIYYAVRPILPVPVRKHLQRTWLMNWNMLPFPNWPVDHTVDNLLKHLLLLALRTKRCETIPFIWFWPFGAPSCAVMTHDIETTLGRDFCSKVMDMDDAYGIKSCFSIVPECRYEVSPDFIQSIKKRGFEILVQDLNHDGRLFKSHDEYLLRVKKINAYAKEFGARGFRSAVLYRNQDWFDQLGFSYDTSVPAVGHLEAQRGGCCTLMPYFIGNLLELPVTTTQDYALFNYLNNYSITLWENQIKTILAEHGLINFIIHPDYITKPREWKVYKDLLEHLRSLADSRGLWIATTGEVDIWWRQRSKLRIIETFEGLKIEGEGSEKAQLAYATEKHGKLVYYLPNIQ